MVCLQKTFEGTNLPVLVHKIVEVSFAPVRGNYTTGLKQLVHNIIMMKYDLFYRLHTLPSNHMSLHVYSCNYPPSDFPCSNCYNIIYKV